MASLGQVYDINDLPKSQGFELLPAGWYQATIAGVEVKSTKDGEGSYLNIRYDILGPSYQGRVVFGRLTVRNKSSRAEDIGRAQMGELMGALGLSKLHDTDQLIGGRVEIKVTVQEDKTGQYEPSNEVRAWKAVAGATLPKPDAIPPGIANPPAHSALPGTGKPPWA